MFVGTEKDAVKNAEAALKALKERDIPPTPTNFTVFYAYLTGVDSDLNWTIDALSADGASLDAAQCTDLYARFFDTGRHDETVDRAAGKLLDEIREILDQVADVSGEAETYGESLGLFTKALDEDDKGTFKPAIDAILQATTLITDKNRSLETRLNSSATEISRLQDDLERTRKEAMTDALTGIANRRQFDRALADAAAESADAGTPLSLIMIDVDHFKKFNAAHGHQMGDQVLKLLASVLSNAVKGQDTPARYGGEEFAIILPDTGLDGAEQLANRIRERICRQRVVNRLTGDDLGRITVSAGAATYRAGEDLDAYVTRADQAPYLAKQSGRDRVMAAREAA